MTNETFRAELKDKSSSSFKSLADGLELEVELILMFHVRYLDVYQYKNFPFTRTLLNKRQQKRMKPRDQNGFL